MSDSHLRGLKTILEFGEFRTTYKYATLHGLVDLCEAMSGDAADLAVSIDLLSGIVVALYWPQLRDFRGSVLRQDSQFEGLEHVRVLQVTSSLREIAERLEHVQAEWSLEYAQGVALVSRYLLLNPLPRLHTLKSRKRLDDSDRLFSEDALDEARATGYLRMHTGAALQLAENADNARDLIEVAWTGKVADINAVSHDLCDLRMFLFGDVQPSRAITVFVEPGWYAIQAAQVDEAASRSDHDLERIAALAPRTPATATVIAKRFNTSAAVAVTVRRRAAGTCELCKSQAPFFKSGGEPYLETHHITWLSQGGDDTVHNMAALCPNCHRKMHSLDLPQDREHLRAVASEAGR